MSLKDWKKEDFRYDWYKIDNYGNGISLDIGSSKDSYIVRTFKIITHVTQNIPIKQKDFKSKSQALKFAKSYMRKH